MAALTASSETNCCNNVTTCKGPAKDLQMNLQPVKTYKDLSAGMGHNSNIGPADNLQSIREVKSWKLNFITQFHLFIRLVIRTTFE